MPIYEYTCQKCDDDFEVLIRGEESPQCPACGAQDLQKLFSVPAAHASSLSKLPMCQPEPSGNCGLPQCGMGGCQME